jgi:hypothetical protein
MPAVLARLLQDVRPRPPRKPRQRACRSDLAAGSATPVRRGHRRAALPVRR